jgi:radical SAM superfamily enzyme YgiQ (UPF0313 family)
MHVLRVSLGFESGSQRMLNMIKGENATVENNRKALNLLKRYPFFVNGGFIIGSPGEHLEDIKDTYSFVKNSGLHGGYAAIAIPYPGTQFWDYAKSENLVSNDMDFARLRTISNYTGLKEGDFIYLAKEININDFLDYGRRFQKYFSRQAALSYLDFGKLNLRILILFLHDPSAFLPDFRRIIAAFFKGIFAKK